MERIIEFEPFPDEITAQFQQFVPGGASLQGDGRRMKYFDPLVVKSKFPASSTNTYLRAMHLPPYWVAA